MTDAVDPTWAAEGDALVRGLAHTLANRVAALGMSVEGMDDEEAVVRAESLAELQREVGRFDALNRLLKLVPREGAGRPEALQPGEVLDDALRLHKHHLELREVPIEPVVAEGVLPVRVERSLLLRALVLLLTAARRAARTEGAPSRGPLRLRLDGDAEEVTVAVPAPPVRSSSDLASLAGALGGRIEHEDEELRLVLPSLLAVRRREAAGKGG